MNGETENIQSCPANQDNRCVEIKSESKSNLGAREPKRVALCVGIDKYLYGNNDLECACSDAKEIYEWVKKAGYAPHLMLSPPEKGCCGIPTSGEIAQKIRELIAGLGVGDVFLFYFAGHGYNVKRDKKPFQGLLCQEESFNSFFSYGLGVERILDITEKNGFTRIIITDACQNDPSSDGNDPSSDGIANKVAETDACPKDPSSEGIANNVAEKDKDSSRRQRDIIPQHGSSTNDEESLCYRDITNGCVLNACPVGEGAGEHGAKGHGLFTEALIHVMSQKDEKSPIVINDEFVEEVSQRLMQQGISQKPKLLSNGCNVELFPPYLYGSRSPTNTTNLHVCDHTVKLGNSNVLNTSIQFTLFETLGRYLLFLQQLTSCESREVGGKKVKFGDKDFRTSVFSLLSRKQRYGKVALPSKVSRPPLTEEDYDYILSNGGMEELARKSETRIYGDFLELKAELESLMSNLAIDNGNEKNLVSLLYKSLTIQSTDVKLNQMM